VTAEEFDPPTLTARAIKPYRRESDHKALDITQTRKAASRQWGRLLSSTWIFMITDGEPQGEQEGALLG